MGTAAPLFLFPLVAEFLNFPVFSSYKSPKLATGILFLLSRRWHYGSSMWFLSCPQPVPSFLNTLPVYQSSLSPPHMAACARNQPQSWRRYGFSTWGIGGAHRPGEIPGYGTPRESWVDFLLTTVSRNLVPYLPLSQSPPSP